LWKKEGERESLRERERDSDIYIERDIEKEREYNSIIGRYTDNSFIHTVLKFNA
jgi:hypothetical protein